MSLRTLIAGKRSDQETPDPVTFDGDYKDGLDLTEALQDAEEPHGVADPKVLAGLVRIAQAEAQRPPKAAVAVVAIPDVRADLNALPLFRATVAAELVRQEGARGHHQPDASWQARYARTWQERIQTFVLPLPPADFGLGRYDGLVDEIVARARFAAEAEYAAQHADEGATA